MTTTPASLHRREARVRALGLWSLILSAALLSGYVQLLQDHVEDAQARRVAARLAADSPAAVRLREAQRDERMRRLEALWHPPVSAAMRRPVGPY